MILSRHDSVCLAEELGEESPGWPIKCLAVPRKLLPVSRGRFITPRQPAGKAVGAMRYSRFVTCLAPGALLWSLLDHLEAQRSPPALSPPNGECRMKNVECSQLLRPNGCRPTSDFWLPLPPCLRGAYGVNPPHCGILNPG